MRRDALRLAPRLRWWFYGVFGTAFVSGSAWLALHAWGGTDSDFGPQPNAAEPWLLRLHGAAAMGVLVILGTMLPLHLQRGWRARRNRGSGGTIVLLCTLLVVSGYALYYAGGEQTRRIAVVLHDGLGLVFPLVLWWHIARGRRARREQESPRAAPSRR